MISELLPQAYLHYRTLPLLGSIIDEFVTWFYEQGYTRGTIRNHINAAKQIDEYLREQGCLSLNDLSHDIFQKVWDYYRSSGSTLSRTVRRIERFLDETVGLEPTSPPPDTPLLLAVNQYRSYLANVGGYADSTIREHIRYVKEFLEYISFDDDSVALEKLSSKDIERFTCHCAQRLNRYSLQHVIGYLRSFLRFQFEQGLLETPLYTMIDTPRIYRLEQLPHCLSWETVKALLDSIDRATPQGNRDYTMLFLIATYGLRTCEIVSLTLEDIDWRKGTIGICQGKTTSRLMLPLTDAAGDVLIEYLKNTRPAVSCRNLFIRVRAPVGPLKPTAVSEVFSRRVRLSGLKIPYYGAHCLRHSYAVHLLRQGTSIKAIGDLMGHRSTESTCIYLRLSVEDLRTVALPVPHPADTIDEPIAIGPVSHRYEKRNPKQPFVPRRGSHHALRSFLAEEIRDYLRLKRSLGRKFANETRTLHGLDAFLTKQFLGTNELTGEIFNKWRTTLTHMSATVQRNHMLHVRAFCLYRRRSTPDAFVPEILTFPANHQKLIPYILSEQQVAKLLHAAEHLRPSLECRLRAETIRLAIILLYTTGLRRGELLRLTLDDFDTTEATLKIEATKFHKSRIIPLSSSVAEELRAYLRSRHKTGIPMESSSALIWNARGGPQGSSYSGNGFTCIWSALCTASEIFTRKGRPPRIHDIRHSFAVNVLQRWYRASEDVQTKLPFLATFMGHVSIVSTHYYLSFVEEIRSEVSDRFHQCFGSAVRPFVTSKTATTTRKRGNS